MRDRLDWYITLFVIVYLSFLVLCTGGCLSSLFPDAPPALENNTNRATKSLFSTMNWLAALSVLGIGLSVFALVNGSKLGLAGIFASSATLVATLTVAKYAIWIAWFGLGGIVIGIALVCIYAVFVRFKAVKEIIKGTQWIRDNLSGGIDKQTTSKMLDKTQSKSTQRLVQQIKGSLKVKGEKNEK